MKNAESVTFGGSGLDRAAEMRGDSDALAARDTARACVFWRGKILLDANDRVMRLPMTHAILQDRSDDLIFLGRENEQLLFAADISRWLPEGFDPDAPISFLDDTRHVHRACIDGGFADIRMSMTLLSARDAEVAATGKAVMEWHRSHGFCAKCGQKSEIKMGGWQRDCPACGTHHFPRTDPVVIMLITHGNAVLMGRSPGWPEGMYSLLAGFIEPGETIEAAVQENSKNAAQKTPMIWSLRLTAIKAFVGLASSFAPNPPPKTKPVLSVIIDGAIPGPVGNAQ